MNLGSSLEPSAHRVSAVRQPHGLFLRAYRFAQTALETQNARRLLDPLALSFQLTRNRARPTNRRVAGLWRRSSRTQASSVRSLTARPGSRFFCFLYWAIEMRSSITAFASQLRRTLGFVLGSAALAATRSPSPYREPLINVSCRRKFPPCATTVCRRSVSLRSRNAWLPQREKLSHFLALLLSKGSILNKHLVLLRHELLW